MSLPISDSAEWLEADGLGGFASGTTTGIRTRRYHALLLTATNPPSERKTLVNGFEAWVETTRGNWFLTSQRYDPDIVYPDGITHLKKFDLWPLPTWHFQLDEDLAIEQQLFVPYGQSALVLIWRLAGAVTDKVKLTVRPLLSGRDFHATHHENRSFRFDADLRGARVRWKPYQDIPTIVAESNGNYSHSPTWYRNFCYVEERARGLDYLEDLASPGRNAGRSIHPYPYLRLRRSTDGRNVLGGFLRPAAAGILRAAAGCEPAGAAVAD